MKSGTIQIVVALLPQRVVLYEVGSGAVHEVERGSGDISTLLRGVLQRYPLRRGMRVVVGSTEFFNQEVRLPEIQTRGLSSGELEAALLFEVEPFSNIGAMQGVAGIAARGVADGVQSWSVTQIERQELEALQGVVVGARGRFAGAVYLSGVVFGGVGQEELGTLLGEVAAAASSGASDYPLVRIKAPSPMMQIRGLLPWCVLFLVVSGCLLHYLYVRRQVAELRRSNQELQILSAPIVQQESVNKKLRDRLKAIEDEKRSRREAQEGLVRYQQAWYRLMRALVSACDERVVLQKIESGEQFECQISGLSSAEKGPAEFFARLEQALSGSGWGIESESMRSTVPATQGHQAVRFSLKATLELPEGVRRGSSSVGEEFTW